MRVCSGRMPASHSAAFLHPPESGAERPVHFSFPISWEFLSKDRTVPQSKPQPDSKRSAVIVGALAGSRPEQAEFTAPPALEIVDSAVTPIAPAPVEIAAPEGTAEPASGDRSDQADRWGMVIPKMSRPAARPSKTLISESRGAQIAAKNPAQPLRQLSASREKAVTDSLSAERGIDERFPAPQFDVIAPKPWRGIPLPVTIGAAAGVALLILGVLLYTPPQKTALPMKPAPVVMTLGPALPAGKADWVPLAVWPRQISVVRGSMSLTDFRMEFQGQINAKAMGWVFRAQDAKNFYAMKLEMAGAGAEARVVLKRFAVIDGRDQMVTQVPLPKGFGPGASFKVRTEGLGDKFTTWISDSKVDGWTDGRLRAGGVGLYHDPGEAGAVVGNVAIFPEMRN
jgi:hypothetical protein